MDKPFGLICLKTDLIKLSKIENGLNQKLSKIENGQNLKWYKIKLDYFEKRSKSKVNILCQAQKGSQLNWNKNWQGFSGKGAKLQLARFTMI